MHILIFTGVNYPTRLLEVWCIPAWGGDIRSRESGRGTLIFLMFRLYQSTFKPDEPTSTMDNYLNIKQYYESLSRAHNHTKWALKCQKDFHERLHDDVVFSDILSTTKNKRQFIKAFSWLRLFWDISFIPLGSIHKAPCDSSYNARSRVTYTVFPYVKLTLHCIHRFSYNSNGDLTYLEEVWKFSLPKPIERFLTWVLTH